MCLPGTPDDFPVHTGQSPPGPYLKMAAGSVPAVLPYRRGLSDRIPGASAAKRFLPDPFRDGRSESKPSVLAVPLFPLPLPEADSADVGPLPLQIPALWQLFRPHPHNGPRNQSASPRTELSAIRLLHPPPDGDRDAHKPPLVYIPAGPVIY